MVKIQLVDDEPNILAALQRLLDRAVASADQDGKLLAL